MKDEERELKAIVKEIRDSGVHYQLIWIYYE